MMSNTTTGAPLASTSTTTSTGPSMALPVTGLVSNNALTSTGLPLPGAHNSGMTGLLQPAHQHGALPGQHAGQSGQAGFVAGIPHLPGTDAMLPPVESHVTLPAPILAPGQAPALLHGGSGSQILTSSTGMHGTTGMHTTGMHGSEHHHTTGVPLATTTTAMPLIGGVHDTHHGTHGAHQSGSHGAHGSTTSGAHPTMMEKLKSHMPGHHAGTTGAHGSDSHHSTTSHGHDTTAHGSHGAHSSTAAGTSTSGAHHPTMMEKIKAHLPGHHGTTGAHSTTTADHHTTDKHLLAEREKESHRLAKEQEKLARERSKESHGHGHDLHENRIYPTGVTAAMPVTGTSTGMHTTGMPLTTGAPLVVTGAPLLATGTQHHHTGEMHHTGAGMHTGALAGTHGHTHTQTTGHLSTPDAILPAGAIAPGAISHTHHIHAASLPAHTTTATPVLMGATALPATHTHTTGAPHLLGGEHKKEYRQDLMAQQPMTTTTTTTTEQLVMPGKTEVMHGTAQPHGHGVLPFPGSHPVADKMAPGTGLMAGQGMATQYNPMLGDGHNAAMDIAAAKMGGLTATGQPQPGYLGNSTMPGAGHLQPVGTTTTTGMPHPVIAGASQVGAINLADPPRHTF